MGFRIIENTIDQGEGGRGPSHHYSDQLANPEDIARLRVLEPSLNVAATAEVEAGRTSCLGGILEVRMQGLNPGTEASWVRPVGRH